MPRLAYLSAAPRLSTRPEAEASGPRAHVLGVIQGFRELGWEVDRFILGDELAGWVSGRGSERAFGGRGARTLAADVLRLFARAIAPGRAMARTGLEVDWVYERFSPFQSVGRAYQEKGIPWILETNGVLFPDALRDRHNLVLWKLARRLELEAYAACDVLVCVSEGLRQAVIRDLPIPASKVIVSEIAVDTRVFDPSTTTAHSTSSDFTIGFAGRLYSWTGLEILFHAIAELDAEDRSRTHLFVVGEGEAGPSLRRLAAELDLEDRVHFIGQVPMDEVPAYIAGFDLGYVAPTPVDPLGMYFSPLKLLEYLAMERPVLASDHQGLMSIVEEGETGFVFEPGDIESLKAAIRRARLSANGFADLGRRGREIVQAGHTWSARVGELVAGIQTILGPRQS
jgi:glycosyltransferase involved in cell wall biosynthesis